MNTDICFGVRMQTYNRKKPKPIPEYVADAIGYVKKQTYPNWKLFLIGDCYEPRSEFRELAKLLPKDKIVAVNLHRAPEREIHTGYNLWACGGITAFNFCLDLMTELGITHCANYDDDDVWFPKHLEYLAGGYAKNPNTVFVCTHGHFKIPNYTLPKFNGTKNGQPVLTSIAGNNCHCACSWDIQKMPLRAKNCIQDTAWAKQCWDYWFWRQFEEQSRQKGYHMQIEPYFTVYQRHTHLKPLSVGHL